MDKPILNLEPSPRDDRDWKAESILDTVAVSGSVDLRKDLQPIRDQGSRGTCAAQTAACMKEWQEKHDVSMDEYFSPEFVYRNRENQGSSGMYSRDVMKILHKKGCCREHTLPYNEINKQIDKKILEEAGEYVIQSYATVDTVDGLKKALSKKGVCYIAVPVYHYGMEMWKQKEPNEKRLGGHAMAVVGYNDRKQHFIIRNSWGTSWGDKGYTYFPYSHWGMQWEVWTALDADSGEPDPWYPIKRFFYGIGKFFKKLFTFPFLPFTLMAIVVISVAIYSLINSGGVE